MTFGAWERHRGGAERPGWRIRPRAATPEEAQPANHPGYARSRMQGRSIRVSCRPRLSREFRLAFDSRKIRDPHYTHLDPLPGDGNH